MSIQPANADRQREQAYNLQLTVNRLQAALSDAVAPDEVDRILTKLTASQAELFALQEALHPAAALDEANAKGIEPVTRRGVSVNELETAASLHLAYIPTAIYHLLDPQQHRLIDCTVRNAGFQKRRVVVTVFIEHYSAQAVTTLELEKGAAQTVALMPTLFAERIAALHELTRATVHVQVSEATGGLVAHTTLPVWLLARNAAPLAVRDPATGQWNDLSHYLGAFVTPNEPSVMHFLRKAARHHPDGQLYGYQAAVEPQVRAIFQALKLDANITYVNSLVSFNPEEGSRSQRVRLPRQALDEQQANCLDGALLFASLLEAASLNPALVILPNHALVAWQKAPDRDEWDYLETTLINSATFEQAADIGRRKAEAFRKQAATGSPLNFRLRALRDLRVHQRITPME
jgi:hypothetical protein